MIKIKISAIFLIVAMLSGCATMPSGDSDGPEMTTKASSNESGHSVGVGMEFTEWGDLAALVLPTRWKSPFATYGSLSWLNLSAWREAPQRTTKILVSEALIVGGGVAVYNNNDSGDSHHAAGPAAPSSSPPSSPTSTPTLPNPLSP